MNKKVENSKNKIKKKIEKIIKSQDDVIVNFDTLEDTLSKTLSDRKDIDSQDFRPRIAVIGVGGAGGNAINNLVKSGLDGVRTIACNTDAQALESSLAGMKIQLGPKSTMGHGAGAKSQVGKLAAIESEQDIMAALSGVHMAFIVAGLGGGTGNGAGPMISKIALGMGILTVGFVTTPFDFEGAHRRASANEGLESFQENCDVLVVIGNQNLFCLSNEETTFLNAFALADDVLCSGVKNVVRTISESGLINTDLADFFTIMKGRKSRARMGSGFAEGERRGARAAQEAMASPLLELGGIMSKDIDGVIICIRCGNDMTLNDVNEAVDSVRNAVAGDANIIFGATIDPSMDGKVQVSVFATSSIAEERVEEQSQTLDFEFSDSAIESFEEMITEEIELGRSHGAILHEDSQHLENAGFMIQEKVSFLDRVLSFFKKSRKKEIPPYFKQ